MAESNFSRRVADWLRKKGCYVLVTTVITGIPEGCPDIIALCNGGGWIALEVKAKCPYKKDGTARSGAFQPLQPQTISKLNDMYYCKVVYPENFEEIKKELNTII